MEVEALAADYLNKPVKVKVGAVSIPTANVAQHLEKLVDAQKVDRLCELLLEEKAEAEKFGGQLPMTIVFVERKARADEIMELLNAEGVSAAAFHGGRSQVEREAALADYKTGRCSVLVATDVAARGLDVKGIAHVVNLDLPRLFEDYVHRVGRTGRAGMTGRATSFYTDRDSYIVAQIKRALQELEAGNAFAFATGKEARAKEREAAKALPPADPPNPNAAYRPPHLRRAANAQAAPADVDGNAQTDGVGGLEEGEIPDAPAGGVTSTTSESDAPSAHRSTAVSESPPDSGHVPTQGAALQADAANDCPARAGMATASASFYREALC